MLGSEALLQLVGRGLVQVNTKIEPILEEGV